MDLVDGNFIPFILKKRKWNKKSVSKIKNVKIIIEICTMKCNKQVMVDFLHFFCIIHYKMMNIYEMLLVWMRGTWESWLFFSDFSITLILLQTHLMFRFCTFLPLYFSIWRVYVCSTVHTQARATSSILVLINK